jgi:HK97 family phage major capsid protein
MHHMRHYSPAALLAGASVLALSSGIKSVRAEADAAAEVKNLIGALETKLNAKFEAQNKAFDEFKAANNAAKDGLDKAKVEKINADITKHEAEMAEIRQSIAALRLSGGGEANAMGGRAALANSAEARSHAQAFNAYFRRGKGEDELEAMAVKASLSEGSNPDGGYTVPVEVETQIDRVLSKVSAMRQISRVITIGGSVYRKPVSQGGATSGWVGEKGARNETDTPKLTTIDFPAMELYAMPAATQALLDDSNINISQWLADEVQIVFSEQEGQAFINGDGQKQPKGLLSYATVADASYAWGKLGYIQVGTGGAFGTDADALIDLAYALKQGYRQNATWLMNRKTQATIRKLKDENDVYLWQPGLQAGQPASLLGYPVVDDDNMDDVGGGKFPIAFGDFQRGYLIVDRAGIRVLRDPYSSKPYVLFYTTKRVGGGVQNFEAIKLGKVAS